MYTVNYFSRYKLEQSVKKRRKMLARLVPKLHIQRVHSRPSFRVTVIPLAAHAEKKKGFEAKTQNQRKAKKALDHEVPILFLIGPAGSGKTYMACSHAIESLQKKHIEKVVIARPTVGCDEEIGFLPGSLDDKMGPWVSPIMDIFHEELGKPRTEDLRKEGLLEICPLAFMRGRTFKNSFVILDEAQNTTPSQMIMALTRIGEGSRMVVTGDISQTDLGDRLSGLRDAVLRLENVDLEHIRCVELDASDIQRHIAVQELLTKMYPS